MNSLYSIDFDNIYSSAVDPWEIGDADSDRFGLYLRLFTQYCTKNDICIDVGCGNGAFTKKLSKCVREIHGIDISKTAIKIANELSSEENLFYHNVSASDITNIGLSFDLLFCSDTLYYMPSVERSLFFDSLDICLKKNATCFFSAWCPGGDYFSEDEFFDLICNYVSIVELYRISSEFVSNGRYIMIIGKRQ